MTVPRIEYLSWARQHYGRVRYDLASSGVPFVGPDDLGLTTAAMVDTSAPERFRHAVARRYGVSPDEVALALGTSGALYNACRALIEPGDNVAVELPAYEPLVRIPESLGALVTRFRRRREDHYTIDHDAVMKALGPTGRVVLVSDLHNPTGMVADRDTLRELAARLAARNGYLLVDEVYRDFLSHRDGVVTARHLGDNVVTVSSLTKVYGVGWPRAGWILGPRHICADAEEVGVLTTGHPGYLFAAAGVAALERIEMLESRARAIAGNKLDRIDAFVRSRRDVTWLRPPGGLFGLVHLASGRPVRPFIEGPCMRRGVLVADGTFFGEPSAFRIGCAAPEDTFVQGLARLGEALDELHKSE